MASTRSRQRKLARDRYERQLVRRAQRQRRRRQVQAGAGVFLVVALLVVGTVWLLGGFDRQEAGPDAQADRCQWLPQAPGPDRIDVGTPPVEPPTSGTRTVTMALDAGGAGSGEITFDLSLDADPCAAASLQHLAAEGFYQGTTCHELVSGALRCGDPRGSGLGGPAYSFFSGQNLPTAPQDDTGEDGEPPLMYPAGTVAFGDPSGAGGSQFLLFYEDFRTDDPLWSVIGEVSGGTELLAAIGAAGTSDSSNAPVDAVVVESLVVTNPEAAGTPGPEGSPAPGPSPSPSGSPGPAES